MSCVRTRLLLPRLLQPHCACVWELLLAVLRSPEVVVSGEASFSAVGWELPWRRSTWWSPPWQGPPPCFRGRRRARVAARTRQARGGASGHRSAAPCAANARARSSWSNSLNPQKAGRVPLPHTFPGRFNGAGAALLAHGRWAAQPERTQAPRAHPSPTGAPQRPTAGDRSASELERRQRPKGESDAAAIQRADR